MWLCLALNWFGLDLAWLGFGLAWIWLGLDLAWLGSDLTWHLVECLHGEVLNYSEVSFKWGSVYYEMVSFKWGSVYYEMVSFKWGSVYYEMVSFKWGSVYYEMVSFKWGSVYYPMVSFKWGSLYYEMVSFKWGSLYYEISTVNKKFVIQMKLDSLAVKLDKMINTQSFFRARESRHRHTLDSNNRRVLWWSLTGCAVILGVGTMQVFVIRSLFRSRRKDRIRT